jgi:hypothetical protein
MAVALALPVLLCGEQMVRRVRLLNGFTFQSGNRRAVVGAAGSGAIPFGGAWCALRFETGSRQRWWTWLVCSRRIMWRNRRSKM